MSFLANRERRVMASTPAHNEEVGGDADDNSGLITEHSSGRKKKFSSSSCIFL